MKRNLPIILLVILLGMLSMSLGLYLSLRPKGHGRPQMRIHFLNVGQGDCVLIQTSDHRNVLVDTGGEETAKYVVDYIQASGIHVLDALIITDVNADHIGGLTSVLSGLGVSQVIIPDNTQPSPEYDQMVSDIVSRKLEHKIASESVMHSISDEVAFDLIWPPAIVKNRKGNDKSNASLILRAGFHDFIVLLIGNLKPESEGRLLASRQDLQSTLVKISIQNSRESISNELLQVIQPEYAIIPSENDYLGTENSKAKKTDNSIYNRLRAIGAQIYRTDDQGTVVVSTDGWVDVGVTAERGR